MGENSFKSMSLNDAARPCNKGSACQQHRSTVHQQRDPVVGGDEQLLYIRMQTAPGSQVSRRTADFRPMGVGTRRRRRERLPNAMQPIK